MKLSTSSYILSCYKGQEGDPPYYVLADKKNPEGSTPKPLKVTDVIEAVPDSTNKIVPVYLAGTYIGDIDIEDENEINSLADFLAEWRESIARLEYLKKKPRNNSTSGDTLNQFLVSHAKDILVHRDLKVRAVTWNIHAQPLSNFGLGELLNLPIMSDVYIFGVQESDPFALYANGQTLDNLKTQLLDLLGSEYKILCTNQLLGMLSIILVSDTIADNISDIEIGSTGTGVLGVWGNKGAIMSRFKLGSDGQIKGTEVTVVNCHLSAGDDMIERRRWEIGEIFDRFSLAYTNVNSVLFDTDARELDLNAAMSQLTTSSKRPTELNRICLFMGDLNYRVKLSQPTVMDLISREDYNTILLHDTLKRDIQERRVLKGFSEAPIGFAPTYKFGTDGYDSSRIPSYTDRILTFCDDPKDLTVTEYATKRYDLSDHRPVVASLELTAMLIDRAKRSSLVAEKLKELDKQENLSRPNVTINPREISTKAMVLTPITEYFEISGGDKLAEYQFIYDRKVLQVEPRKGTLPANSKQTIKVSCMLHLRQSLNEVIVLRILGHQDIFIPVAIESLDTCLGLSLDAMAKYKGATGNMPMQICNLVDYLWDRLQPKLFETKGDVSIEQQVQEWLDTPRELDAEVLDMANEYQNSFTGTFSVAQVFIRLLHSLPETIVPSQYLYLIDNKNATEGFKLNSVLETIPSVNANVLLYLKSFLSRLVEKYPQELESVRKVFEPVFFNKQTRRTKLFMTDFILNKI